MTRQEAIEQAVAVVVAVLENAVINDDWLQFDEVTVEVRFKSGLQGRAVWQDEEIT